MIYIKRALFCFVLFITVNALLIINPLKHGLLPAGLMYVAVFLIYLLLNIFAIRQKTANKRLAALSRGFELILSGFICLTAQIAGYALFFLLEDNTLILDWLLNAAVCFIMLTIVIANGAIRLLINSRQVGLMLKLLLIIFWWLPILNLALLFAIVDRAAREFRFADYKYNLNQKRKGEELCKTKYPLLLVHGIFFRDWAAFNYWGRIPDELKRNGAVIYYGNHQSSVPVEQSAQELKQSILKVIEEQGCEKVNIIAHSKGGIDSRYAISKLGMGRYVASLTTINTPHRGCNYVKRILETTPDKVVDTIGKHYKNIFKKLGDESPDLYGGLLPLTDEGCTKLNEIMPDDPEVVYQSVGSMLKSAGGASFPFNVGHIIMKSDSDDRYDENDGLVAVRSMEWGNFLGLLKPKGRKGISHGDMVDLTRKDISGFDVCEFYVDLVNGLKTKGL